MSPHRSPVGQRLNAVFALAQFFEISIDVVVSAGENSLLCASVFVSDRRAAPPPIDAKRNETSLILFGHREHHGGFANTPIQPIFIHSLSNYSIARTALQRIQTL